MTARGDAEEERRRLRVPEKQVLERDLEKLKTKQEKGFSGWDDKSLQGEMQSAILLQEQMIDTRN